MGWAYAHPVMLQEITTMEAILKNVVIPLIADYGIPLALVIFFVWRDYKREQNLSGIITRLEHEMRDILTNQATNVTKALINNTACMREIIGILRKCPCSSDAIKEGQLKDYKEG